MAPRPLESRDQFIARLRAAAARAATQPIGFGGHHFTHVVVREDDGWKVRRLVLDRARADAYREQHGIFMPEHAEMLSEPGPVVIAAESLEALIAALAARPWPLLG